MVSRLLRFCERFVLGEIPSPTPPGWLLAVWAVVLLSRLPAAFFSLGEDDIWNLVVAVDGPWSRVFFLGGDPFATNHVLYTALSKALIKLAGHQAMELVYRLPTLAAGALALPLAYWAGCRLGGPRAGRIASLLYALAPAVAYHALNARGYMLWSVVALWCLALLAQSPRLGWRLAVAYVLLTLSHGLGPVTLAGFLVLGPWLGIPAEAPRAWRRNIFLALPALPVAAHMMVVMTSYKAVDGRFRPDMVPVETWLFPFQWFDENLGSLWLPGLSAIWIVPLAAGLVLAAKAHPLRALLLLGLGFGIPLLFAASGEQGGYARFALGGFGGWALAIALGAARLLDRAFGPETPAGGPRSSFPDTPAGHRAKPGFLPEGLFLVATLLLWAPNLKAYSTLPLQVDYLGSIRDVRRDHPKADTLYGLSPEFATGLSYYGRRHGLTYHVLGSAAEAEAALLAHPEDFALVWMPPQQDIDPSLPPWVAERLHPKRIYRSAEVPIGIYVPRATP